MDLGRESIGLTQKEFQKLLNAEGVDCTTTDISRCKNGYAEMLLYIGFKAVEIADRVQSQEKALQPFKRACKRSEYEQQILSILSDGKKHSKTELSIKLGLSERAVRQELQYVKYFYPIIQSPYEQGYAIAQNENSLPAVSRLLAEYESKKKIASRQEYPLIAFKYKHEKKE